MALADEHFDLILIGSSFASSFFLLEYLRHAGSGARVLVLERGKRQPKGYFNRGDQSAFVNRNPRKDWTINLQFGGASNCWWACTPRMIEDDFRLHSRFGIGRDWPISYDDLETFYTEVEEIMAVSGPDDGGPWPRSRPYPQPPHTFTAPDRLLKQAFPDHFFHQPCARPTRGTKNRMACCASGICHDCPVDSKFTVTNELLHLYEDPRVTLRLEARAERLLMGSDRVSGVLYETIEGERTANAEFIGLGANAIFNPFLMLRSGLVHPLLGRRLHEQVAVSVAVDLDGLENFQGSTSITGHGYMLYLDRDRSRLPAALMETSSVPDLRAERGRWRERLNLKFIFEDLPSEHNLVREAPGDPTRPETVYTGHSDFCQRGIDSLVRDLPGVLAPLPVEKVRVNRKHSSGQSHILGTTVMGDDAATSVVDRHLIHHRYRNLAVLGSSPFPTAAPANPTLTLAALSMWSARALYGVPANARR